MALRVYKIVNDVDEQIYVGSTKESLRKRLYNHKHYSQKGKYKDTILLYKFANSIGWECFSIVLLEEVEYTNHQDRLTLEQKWLDKLEPTLNKSRCVGVDVCDHGVRRFYCVPCRGNGVCEHERLKAFCIPCQGNQVCKHDKVKSNCKECGTGKKFCEHEKIKQNCRQCEKNICEHKKFRADCTKCSKSYYCDICKVSVIWRKKDKHLNGVVHKHNIEKDLTSFKFTCETCNFGCPTPSKYKRHLESKKHKLNMISIVY